MSRYGSNSNNDSEYGDETEVKIQPYAALRLTPDRVNAYNGGWGDQFIANFTDGAVIDGVVFERDDKEGVWKVFSLSEDFHVDEDGLVREQEGDDETLSAEEILTHDRVVGFSEKFGGDKYHYTPVGVVNERQGEVAVNPDKDAEVEDGEIQIGDVSMFLTNSAWVRTFAKKVTSLGEEIIEDNGSDDPDENPKYADYGWLTTDEPELRDEIEDREIEMHIEEQTFEGSDGDEGTFRTPVVLDSKTENQITIENGVQSDDDTEDADGGATAEADDSGSQEVAADGGPEQTEDEDDSDEAAEADDESDDESEAADVPDALDDLIDYFVRQDEEPSAEEFREFAENEVEDPDDVDWEAAAQAVKDRS